MQGTLERELLGELSKKLGTEALFEISQVLNRVLPMYEVERLGQPCHGNNQEDIYQHYNGYMQAKRAAGRSETTMGQYDYQIKEFVAYINKCPSEATPEDVNNFLDYIEIRRSLSKHSKALRRVILSSFYTWMQTNGHVRLNPVRQTEPIKYKSTVREALTREELERCRSACRYDLRMATMLELFFSTGCRRAEILDMDLRDINWSGRYIRVLGKENKERFVFFSERAGRLLWEYLNGRQEGAVFLARRSPCNPIGKQAIGDELAKIGRLAGLVRKLHPHLLRHTFAVTMIEHNVSINDVSVIMGHADLKTTAIYAKSSLARLRQEHARAID